MIFQWLHHTTAKGQGEESLVFLINLPWELMIFAAQSPALYGLDDLILTLAT